MTRLVQAELLKLRTTRTTYALLGSALVIVLGVLILVLAFVDHGATINDDDLGDLFTFTVIADLLLLSLGIVGAAGEFRHGTITSALLVTPTRWPVIVAKAIAYALVGLVYALATVLLCLVIALPWLAIKDATFDLGGAGWVQPVIGRLLYAMITAVLGVGIGTLFRNQAAGLVVALVYLLAVEQALSIAWHGFSDYGINGASLALFGANDALSFGVGALLFFGYAVLFVGAGSALLLRKDVS